MRKLEWRRRSTWPTPASRKPVTVSCVGDEQRVRDGLGIRKRSSPLSLSRLSLHPHTAKHTHLVTDDGQQGAFGRRAGGGLHLSREREREREREGV
jgi:hypothetical protein